MNLLLDVYLAQEKWSEAQSLLLEKIALGSRSKSRDDGQVLTDILALVDVLIHKNSHAEALLYGRRALKGYRRMGSDGVLGVESSLKALVRVCHMSGNYDEEDAYAAILSDFLQLNSTQMSSTDGAQSSEHHVTSPSPASTSPVPQEKTSLHQNKQQEGISNVEQRHGKDIQEDIDAVQRSRILEKRHQIAKDDIIQRLSTIVPTVTKPPHLPSNETEEKISEGTSTTVTENTILPKRDERPLTLPPNPRLLALTPGMSQYP